MARTDFTDGDALPESDLDGNFIAAGEIKQIYTGTGFNSSVSGANQSDTQNHELTAISAANLGNADYLIVEIAATHRVQGTANTTATTSMKIETKEIAGAYSDSMTNQTMFQQNSSDTNSGNGIRTSKTLKWVHTLTAGEKSNGVQVRIESNSSTGNQALDDASVTNIQTGLSLAY